MSGRRRLAIIGTATTAAVVGATAMRRTTRRPSDPGSPDAIHAEDAQARAVALVAQEGVRRADLAMTFAPAVSTSVDPLLHGHRYFPRMLEDIAAATDHIHLLIYGYKPGDIGTTFLEALGAKAAAGVEVRLAVDAIGSETDFGSKELFRALLDAGVEVVAHDGLFVARTGTVGARKPAAKGEDLLHFDHRKMAVIDGTVGYVGGSGIEDHYNDERFYDVMCRVTGPIVAQLQTVFLASWRHHDGARPEDPALARYYPAEALKVPARAKLKAPTTILWNVPGTGHHPISDAIEHALETATLADRHRQPVHLEPGDPGAAAGGGGARRGGPPHRARASPPRPIRPRRSGTGIRGCWRPARRSCSTRRWRTPRSCASTARSSSAGATSTTSRCSATTSWTSSSRIPPSSRPPSRRSSTRCCRCRRRRSRRPPAVPGRGTR